MDPVFEGSGMGSLRTAYEAVQWSHTVLGPPERWSPALRSTVALALNTRFPVTLLWGPEFALIYNEPYAELIGDKHPAALGAPARSVFPEIWDAIGPLLANVRAGRGALWVRDERLLLQRHGFDEETYFTFSYSPVCGPTGDVEGVIDICAETTREVIDRRRLVVLAELTNNLLEADDPRQVVTAAVKTLENARDDVLTVALRGPSLPDPADPGTSPDRPPVPAAPPPADGLAPSAATRSPTVGRRVDVRHTTAGSVARLPLDGSSPASRGAVLTIGLSRNLSADGSYLDFVQLVATAVTQALDRVSAQLAERRSAELERQMSEALQRSLLSEPAEPDHLQVAVRYRAAAEQAQVGGDWYDSFLRPNGTLTLVVGDVSGHDRQAAAAMAQIRNLLRGVAFTLQEPPAAVLASLDAAIRGLSVDVLATAVLAQIDQDQPDGRHGRRTVRWSNAGHLPPVLVGPDGHTEVLRTAPDMLLGVNPGTARHDHAVVLEPGSTLVLYTDGLIERRDTDLDDQIELLLAELRGRRDLDAEQVCDRLLERFGADTDDDIVLLALHAYPEEGPRPDEAGPQRRPAYPPLS